MNRHNDPLFQTVSNPDLDSDQPINNDQVAHNKNRIITLTAPHGRRITSDDVELEMTRPKGIDQDAWMKEKALNTFQLLLCKSSERDHYSNVLDVWELLPRFTGETYNRSSGKKFPSQINIKFSLSGRRLHILQTPGNFVERRDKEGNKYVKQRYPGHTEHLVEQAIIKLAIEQAYLEDGHPGSGGPNYSINFTLKNIRDELKKQGVNRNAVDIRKALEVLATSSLEIKDETPKRKSDYEERTTFITSLKRISLSESGSTLTTAGVYCVTLNRIVAHGIGVLGYRQYRTDFTKGLSYAGSYIYRRLLVDQLNVNSTRGFSFLFTEIRELTFGLRHPRITTSLTKLSKELEKMIEQGVISNFTRNDIYHTPPKSSRSSVVDAEFEVFPSSALIAEIKKSHLKTGVAADALGLSMDNHNQLRLQLPPPQPKEK